LVPYNVVKFIVNVRLIEKSVKSHVGSVIVANVMIQYRILGIVWKTKENVQPTHPTMVVGIGGGNSGGGR
jgi:predicted alternative tryptophan synthase beta-subunit